MNPTTLKLSSIRFDGGTQPRESIDQAMVDEYADAMKAGAEFPPGIVFYDGTDYWLADGFHRARAAEQAGNKSIKVEVRQGIRRDAILYSVGANTAHGVRRTNADKRRAVMTLLNDAEWAKWSDREIAKRTGTSNAFVGGIRPPSLLTIHSEPKTYTTKHGTTSTMKTANIGRSEADPAEAKSIVQKHAVPELAAAVERGDVSINAAATIAVECPPERQKALVEKGRRAVSCAANNIRFNQKKGEGVNGNGHTMRIVSEPEEIKAVGVGVDRANEAINCLIRIPKNDALRKRGFQIVTDWISHNS